MRKVVSIKNFMGVEIPLDDIQFIWVGADRAMGRRKDSCFCTMYSKADGYTVTTVEIKK